MRFCLAFVPWLLGYTYIYNNRTIVFGFCSLTARLYICNKGEIRFSFHVAASVEELEKPPARTKPRRLQAIDRWRREAKQQPLVDLQGLPQVTETGPRSIRQHAYSGNPSTNSTICLISSCCEQTSNKPLI